MFLGLFLLSGVIVGLIFSELRSTVAYGFSVFLIEVIGFSLYRWGKKKSDGTLMRKEAIATVALTWIGISILGALPYMIDGAIVNPVDAFFESVSGFTTTGSTILIDIEALSHTSLFWRSLTQWLGGMGIVVLFIAIFPRLGVGAKQLFKSEVPGPITQGVRPRIKETSSLLWKIYIGLTLLVALLLYLEGMSVFDAICHSLTTMATGGFSTKNASIKFYDSAAIDYTLTLFMLLGSINFTLYYFLLKGNIKRFLRDTELKFYLILVSLFTLIVTFNIYQCTYDNFFVAFRHGIFQVVSIVTTTGYATDNYLVYPFLSQLIIVIVMFTGGSAGSTSGGLKMSRMYIALKITLFSVFKFHRPQHIKALQVNQSSVPPELSRNILSFIFLYLFLIFIGTLFMSMLGLDTATSFSSALSSISNIGPGFGDVGPISNFSSIPDIGKLFMCFYMIMGRLELYTFLVLMIPSFWRR